MTASWPYKFSPDKLHCRTPKFDKLRTSNCSGLLRSRVRGPGHQRLRISQALRLRVRASRGRSPPGVAAVDSADEQSRGFNVTPSRQEVRVEPLGAAGLRNTRNSCKIPCHVAPLTNIAATGTGKFPDQGPADMWDPRARSSQAILQFTLLGAFHSESTRHN